MPKMSNFWLKFEFQLFKYLVLELTWGHFSSFLATSTSSLNFKFHLKTHNPSFCQCYALLNKNKNNVYPQP